MTSQTAFLGVDIGTSSSKGVLVSRAGVVLRSAERGHAVDRPASGHVEMDPEVWWREFVELAGELTAPGDVGVAAVGVSGMGPCTVLADAQGRAVRPAILYGIDTRSGRQIAELNDDLGEAEIVRRCGSALSSQAVGPKILWVREHEPERYAAANWLLMASSLLVHRLTGEYVLDHHSASQCTPMYDSIQLSWQEPWCRRVAPDIELPRLTWPGEVAGVTAAVVAGIDAGTPVITGTIDAWSEALSVGAQGEGDLMLMYGTTMFLISTGSTRVASSTMWGTVGAMPGTYNLAGGMATSGAITAWLRELCGGQAYETLLAEAGESGPGARGLLMLPYFAGERTPIADPDARGALVGLSLDHRRGDLYRAALEATAFGVRHNIEALRSAGADPQRVVAVGGGTKGSLWTQIVSDVADVDQVVPRTTIGASYGAAFLAAGAVHDVSIAEWNPALEIRHPCASTRPLYDDLYVSYRELYGATRTITHRLARRQSTTMHKEHA